jgi:hypothetical protein
MRERIMISVIIEAIQVILAFIVEIVKMIMQLLAEIEAYFKDESGKEIM